MQLVVKMAPGAMGAALPGLTMKTAAPTLSVVEALRADGLELRPLFARTRAQGIKKLGTAAPLLPETMPRGSGADLEAYFTVDVPDAEMLDVAARLRKREGVLAAYVKPPAEPAMLNTMMPSLSEPPSSTPDLTGRQAYRDPAPGGVDAVWAASQPGGTGEGISIIDVEGAWRFTHEAFRSNPGGDLSGMRKDLPDPDLLGWRNHGTAVVGTIFGLGGGEGITGIAPGVRLRGISIFPNGTAPAIRTAADILHPGDIILVEAHRPGLRYQYQSRNDQKGYIPVEWWPDDYAAIAYATGRGVIVVAAAGNGAENLDDPFYDSPDPGFGVGWGNPFKRGTRDSGSILVGAGAPPPGTHGRDCGPDRSHLAFSNHGESVDAQGWGREVTTTGYGDLQGGPDEDCWYTDRFSGTSSASPIVVACLACAQGFRRAHGRLLLDPGTARQLLRATGTPQEPTVPGQPITERIGSRPNLRDLMT